ncbi:hypothetical protein HK097_000995, partial [Rhizophlyctis rosea]
RVERKRNREVGGRDERPVNKMRKGTLEVVESGGGSSAPAGTVRWGKMPIVIDSDEEMKVVTLGRKARPSIIVDEDDEFEESMGAGERRSALAGRSSRGSRDAARNVNYMEVESDDDIKSPLGKRNRPSIFLDSDEEGGDGVDSQDKGGGTHDEGEVDDEEFARRLQQEENAAARKAFADDEALARRIEAGEDVGT